jgi:aminoglycoside phosphotransferase (APT) family kinase protein
LTGHSGCHLSLLSADGRFFVRKSSAAPAYNQRLRGQCLKQAAFAKGRQNSPVRAPKVLGYGVRDGDFWFDMEFVAGKTVAEAAPVVLTSEMACFIKALFDYILSFGMAENPKANLIFREKINDLEKTITMSEPAERSLRVLKNFDWRHAYESPCHGDLTLENIIVAPDKKLYLIDFLDSFYNSWLMDLAKLLQDLELGWSFRGQPPDANRSIRLLIAKEALLGEIARLDNAPQILVTIYHLLLLNILRIYPYSKDRQTETFLHKSLAHALGIVCRMSRGED